MWKTKAYLKKEGEKYKADLEVENTVNNISKRPQRLNCRILSERGITHPPDQLQCHQSVCVSSEDRRDEVDQVMSDSTNWNKRRNPRG